MTAVSMLAAAPAHASFPGSNGSLASEYREIDRGGEDDREIQVFGPNGEVSATLSHCSRPEFGEPSGVCPQNPSFSPDGRQLAFDAEGRLALAAPDGTGLVTLPKLTAADADPAFSPDGTKLVFTGRADGKHNLYIVGVDGSGLERLTNAGGKRPAWSSTGQIAYCDRGRVWRLSPGERGRTRVAKGCYPDWSPSGKSLAYEYNRNTYRAAARKGAPRRLVRKHAERPAFSPDGKRLAFERPFLIAGGSDSLGASIYTVDAGTGKRLKQIRRGGELPIGSTYGYFTGVAWQPLAAAGAAKKKPPRPCPPGNTKTLEAGLVSRAYMRKGAVLGDGEFDPIFLCTYRPRRHIRIGFDACFNATGIELIRFAGRRFLALSTSSCGPGGSTATVRVRSARTGRAVRALDAAPGVQRSFDQANPTSMSVTDLELRADGAVAWIVRISGARDTPDVTTYQVRTSVSAEESEVLAEGGDIAPGSLALAGSTLYWTQGGTARSASVP